MRQPYTLGKIKEDMTHRDAATFGKERGPDCPVKVIRQRHVLTLGTLDRLERRLERDRPLRERRMPRLPRQFRLC